MATDPESFDEVQDPIAEDEVEVVETGDVNERSDGEEVAAAAEESVDLVDTDPPEESDVSIEDAEGAETDT